MSLDGMSCVLIKFIVLNYIIKMILLSLYSKYQKLYCLALGGNSFSVMVETQNHSNKLLSSTIAFLKHNWRWLHTLLFLNYLFEANFVLPPKAFWLKVWSLNVGQSQPQLFRTFWFGSLAEACMELEASLKKALKFLDIFCWSYSNLIGLVITCLHQLIFSTLVIGPIAVGW